MREKIKWLEKYAPLGMDVSVELTGYLAGVVIATLQSMSFLYNYANARGELFITRAGKLVVEEGAIIKDFATLTKGVFVFMAIICAMTLFRAVYYYMYHSQGSKMLYLMKRLPDKGELRKRCITLPIAGAVLLAVWAVILRMIYFSIYILCTPSQCLPL